MQRNAAADRNMPTWSKPTATILPGRELTIMSKIRIVLAHGALADYPEGGGHWMAYLQYLLGLDDLGHDVLWLEVMRSSGRRELDQARIKTFFERMAQYGFQDRCALLLRIRSRIHHDNDMSTQEVVCGSRDGNGPPVSTACEHAVKRSSTFFPCWRQVATMVRMLATKRPPATLSLP
jgi:hypothetical protein